MDAQQYTHVVIIRCVCVCVCGCGGGGVINPLGPIARNVVIILSALSCDFRQCPWEIGSVTADRAGLGEVGGCTRRVQTAWPCLGSGVERSWSGLGGPFPSILA